MVALPALIPVTKPLTEPIVTTAVLLLLQVPPPVPSLKVALSPEHKEDNPVIGDMGLTLITWVTKQPVVNL
jgi:hypothetical protein